MNHTFLIRKLYECLWWFRVKLPLHNNQLKGWYGEWLALRYLNQKKYSILHKNWRSPLDARREIDLLCMDDQCLVFIEVRARSAQSLNSGYHSISMKKKKTLLSACRDFLRVCSDEHSFYRFDVIEIDLDGVGSRLFHHENVSLFP